ncbi:TetR/AcrR family transcriptional regulator [Paenibacillus brevis]|uniref:TetR/AcrR family transcriptional regulator n=1 Tax=Paenibacillus brevis TaxID=2841508 RepID=UPI00201A6353|nr:TetR/AcrR family transcriptional regulator [Paenibacillus brevis]
MLETNKRDAILKAALALFAKRGYDGTTVPMIANTAQVGAGTIYRYFENKETLVNALFQQCVQEFSETLKFEEIDPSSDMRDQFHYIFKRLIKFADTNIHALLFIESHNSAYYIDVTSRKAFQGLMETLRQMMQNGKDRGVIKDLQTDALIALVYGAFVMLFKLIQAGLLDESEAMLKEVEESCWNAIKIL